MCETQDGLWGRSGSRMLRRIIPLIGVMLGSMALMCAAASSASAASDGIFLAGEASEVEAKQPRLEAESYPVKIKSSASLPHRYTFQAGSLECAVAEGTGTASGPTKALTLSPSYSFCATNPSTYIELFMNGCNYVLNIKNVGPPYKGKWDIKCPSEQGITIVSKVSQLGSTLCTITIAPQTGLESVSLTNTGSGSSRAVSASFNLSGIKYTQVKGAAFGCTSGEFENGTYTGQSTLRGES